jgi:hypothetical protein
VGDDIGVYGLPDWEWLWAAPGTYIEDEYGDPVDPAHMKDIITNRTSRDPAIALRRHTDGGIRGVVRGEGTWDLIPGDFS